MREAQEGGDLPPKKIMGLTEALEKQGEIIEGLARLDRELLRLLSQHVGVEEYERRLAEILREENKTT